MGGGRAVFVLLPWLSSTRVTQYLGPRTVGPDAWAPCLSALRAVDALERHYRKSDVKALDHQLKEGGPGRSRFLARHGLTWIPRGALCWEGRQSLDPRLQALWRCGFLRMRRWFSSAQLPLGKTGEQRKLKSGSFPCQGFRKRSHLFLARANLFSWTTQTLPETHLTRRFFKLRQVGLKCN